MSITTIPLDDFTITENEEPVRLDSNTKHYFVSSRFTVSAIPSSSILIEDADPDEGHWVTIADFSDLEEGGVDLDELIARL